MTVSEKAYDIGHCEGGDARLVRCTIDFDAQSSALVNVLGDSIDRNYPVPSIRCILTILPPLLIEVLLRLSDFQGGQVEDLRAAPKHISK